MTQTKLSADKVAANDIRDREFAYEFGFSKFAQEKGLSEAQFKTLYETAMAKLASLEQPKA